MSSVRSRPVPKKQPSVKETDATTVPNANGEPADDAPRATLQRQPSMSQTITSTVANLANLLPTGTLLAFQLLTPIFTNNGACDSATRLMTLGLLFLLAFSCFLACFTDSVKADDGQVYYGFATFKGLWLYDYPTATGAGLPNLSKYKVRFMDGIHAVLSVLVFGAVALRDRNVSQCLYPAPGRQTQEVLNIVPVGVGLICSLLFMVFPTTRHGIGYPVTPVRRWGPPTEPREVSVAPTPECSGRDPRNAGPSDKQPDVTGSGRTESVNSFTFSGGSSDPRTTSDSSFLVNTPSSGVESLNSSSFSGGSREKSKRPVRRTSHQSTSSGSSDLRSEATSGDVEPAVSSSRSAGASTSSAFHGGPRARSKRVIKRPSYLKDYVTY